MRIDRIFRILVLSLCLAAVVAGLVACGTQAVSDLHDPTTEPSPEPSSEPTPEPSPEPETPATRAAALGLPAPPEIDITSWEFKLLNSFNSIGWYEPKVSYFEGQSMDERVLDAVNDLIYAARYDGQTAYIAVGTRNLEYTLNTWLSNFAEVGEDPIEAAKTMLPLGSNEHQSGLAMDLTNDIRYISSYYPFEDDDIWNSELYAWVKEHCAEYGFILRYPQDKAHWYGLACEHLHLRYVGVDAARYIMDNDLCLEEFLRLYDPDAVFIPERYNIFES